jgi:hypothetical protein
MANDLLITINADAKNAKKAFDDIRSQTSDLENSLKSAALISGVAFAALTAEVFLSVKAFEEAEKASVQLSNALQNQGIFTEELKTQYEEFAQAVQAKTGIDDDAIIKAQAIAQTFLGQTEITLGLTEAIADLAAAQGGDLNSAAEKIARTIGTGTNAFARQGLVIRENSTEAERLAQVLEFVRTKSGGLAEELNKADGFSRALSTSFGNLQEAIGARFAPVVVAVRQAFISLFDTISGSPILTNLVVAAIAAGAAVAGIITFITLAVPAFLALSAAATALGLSLSVALVGIPLIIGGIVAAITLLALNWDKALASIKAAAVGAVTLLTELFGGLSKLLQGVFTFNADRVRQGLSQVTNAFRKAKDETIETYTEITAAQKEQLVVQDANKKAAADKEAAFERQHQANLRAIRKAELDLLQLQNQNASAATIALKTREIEVLKALDSQKSAQELALFRERHARIKELQNEQQAEDLERAAAFDQIKEETAAEFKTRGIEVDAQIRDERLAQIEATAQTENDIDRQLQEEVLTRRIAARNQELIDRKKYGESAAKISKALNSEEVQGTKSAAGELVALQESKNATLKSIGKIAAVAQITISTAESAMNIYRGFSTIPIIGPALGVAGAAAAIAFGAERISRVTAAQSGGLIEGGIPGLDSVPALLEPGELIVPRKNFNEVVGAIKGEGEVSSDSQMVALLESIDAKFSNPQTTIIQGDVSADDSYIDSLVRRISDAIEFRNAEIVGVTT